MREAFLRKGRESKFTFDDTVPCGFEVHLELEVFFLDEKCVTQTVRAALFLLKHKSFYLDRLYSDVV